MKPDDILNAIGEGLVTIPPKRRLDVTDMMHRMAVVLEDVALSDSDVFLDLHLHKEVRLTIEAYRALLRVLAAESHPITGETQ